MLQVIKPFYFYLAENCQFSELMESCDNVNLVELISGFDELYDSLVVQGIESELDHLDNLINNPQLTFPVAFLNSYYLYLNSLEPQDAQSLDLYFQQLFDVKSNI
jgi:hypothetical protein